MFSGPGDTNFAGQIKGPGCVYLDNGGTFTLTGSIANVDLTLNKAPRWNSGEMP